MSCHNTDGYIIVYENEPRYKGCDEYIADETTGLRSSQMNEAHVFPSLKVAKDYEKTRYKGVVPKAHLPAKFVKVQRQTSVRTVVV